jgi:hypothetical protein
MWDDLFSDERFSDIFVPSMEETNSRVQSFSLSGRTGLWMKDAFKTVSGRAVTDNANYNRQWEWGQTQHLSHMIRAMSQRRLQGADLFHINIYTENETEMMPFYLMLEKGILPRVRPHEMISMNEIAVGVKSPPDHDYIEHGTNGHDLYKYSPNEPELVVDKLDCYWGGAIVPENDLTRILFNSKRRMTNFIAQSPYGNVATIPANTDLSALQSFSDMVVTDGKFWYDENDNPLSPADFRSTLIEKFETAAEKLPVRVSGEVAWSAIQIDSSVIRVVLIDPGYLDPEDREAVITIKDTTDIIARDILSGEILPIANNKINVTVPMGILRVIDFVVYPIAYAGEDIFIEDIPVDSVVFHGTGTDNVEIVSYEWEQISGPECTLIQPDSATLIVKGTGEGVYKFRLTVTDNLGNTDTDDVMLTIDCIECKIPEVDAGNNRTARLPIDTLMLKGTVLKDGRGIQQLEWAIYSGPEATLNQDSATLILSDLEPGNYKFSFTATSIHGYSHTDFVEVEILEAVAAPETIAKTTNPIIIDGQKEEYWCGTPYEIDSMVLGYFDTYSTVQFMWNDSFFFGFLEIEDKYKFHDSGEDWKHDDAVDLFIDPDNSKSEEWTPEDFHFGIRLADSKVFETIQGATNIECVSIENGDYYNLEFAIPWSVLNITPVPGTAFGLEMYVRDDFNGVFNDAIEALYGFSGELEPTPVLLGTVALAEECVWVGFAPQTKSELSIFPTVTNEKIFISNPGETILGLAITNVQGSILKRENTHKNEIDLSTLSDGIYFITIQTEKDSYFFKCLKTR